MLLAPELKKKDHWEIVIELTNDDGSETKAIVGCRTLESDWKTVEPTSLSRSIGMLFRIPASIAEDILSGLDYAIWGYLT